MMARVAADGSRWPGTRAHSALLDRPGSPDPAVISSKDRPDGLAHVDAVEDRRRTEVGEPTGRALVGRGNVGGVTHTPSASSAPGRPDARR